MRPRGADLHYAAAVGRRDCLRRIVSGATVVGTPVGSVQGDTHPAGRACPGALLIGALAGATPRRCGTVQASAAARSGLADGDLLGLWV